MKEESRVHVCKTYVGEIGKVLDDLVNRKRVFSSYTDAVGQAVLAYYRRFVEDELRLSRLQAVSENYDSGD